LTPYVIDFQNGRRISARSSLVVGLIATSEGSFRRIGLYGEGMSSQDADTDWEIGVIIMV
jgi:hypothetical protein